MEVIGGQGLPGSGNLVVNGGSNMGFRLFWSQSKGLIEDGQGA